MAVPPGEVRDLDFANDAAKAIKTIATKIESGQQATPNEKKLVNHSNTHTLAYCMYVGTYIVSVFRLFSCAYTVEPL